MAYITDDNDNLIEVERTSKPNLEGLIKEHSKEVQIIEKLNAINEFYKSLISAVEAAGGSPDWITEATTVKELADCLAVNDVRFNYIKLVRTRDCIAVNDVRLNHIKPVRTRDCDV